MVDDHRTDAHLCKREQGKDVGQQAVEPDAADADGLKHHPAGQKPQHAEDGLLQNSPERVPNGRLCPHAVPPCSVVSVFPGEIPHPQIEPSILLFTHIPVNSGGFAEIPGGKIVQKGLHDFFHPGVSLPVRAFSMGVKEKPNALEGFIVVILEEFFAYTLVFWVPTEYQLDDPAGRALDDWKVIIRHLLKKPRVVVGEIAV